MKKLVRKNQFQINHKSHLKAGLTLHDLYDTTCMTHSWFSNFHCVYTLIQVVHTEFQKNVPTEYSAFKRSSIKMIQEQAVAAVIFPLISEKSKSREKVKKEESL